MYPCCVEIWCGLLVDDLKILSQPLSVESEQGFGAMKERMVSERGDIINKYKRAVPDDNPQVIPPSSLSLCKCDNTDLW